MHMRRLLPGITALGVLLGSTSAAYADIFFNEFPYHGPAGGENVLYNVAGLLDDGTVVEGQTNQSNTKVRFSSLRGEALSTPSSGQARVTGLGDGRINWDFSITAADSKIGFNSIYFKVNSPNQTSPLFQVRAEDFDGNIFTSNVLTGQNGEPAFRVFATNGQFIKSLIFDVQSGAFTDIRQVRVGVAAIPEASTLLSFGGLLGAGGLFLKRARKRS